MESPTSGAKTPEDRIESVKEARSEEAPVGWPRIPSNGTLTLYR